MQHICIYIYTVYRSNRVQKRLSDHDQLSCYVPLYEFQVQKILTEKNKATGTVWCTYCNCCCYWMLQICRGIEFENATEVIGVSTHVYMNFLLGMYRYCCAQQSKNEECSYLKGTDFFQLSSLHHPKRITICSSIYFVLCCVSFLVKEKKYIFFSYFDQWTTPNQNQAKRI